MAEAAIGPATPSRIRAVIVTYNSGGHIASCLQALRHPQVEVVVVDNESTDDTVVQASRMGATVISMRQNAGYARACNAGARLPSSRQPDWVAFINPDARLRGSALVAACEDAPGCLSALCPLMADQHGSLQYDIARAQLTARGLLADYLLVGMSKVREPRVRRGLRRSVANQGTRYFSVFATSGGSLLVRTNSFEAMGGFDEAYFLNGEDIDLCARMRLSGLEIAVDCHIAGLHLKGTSSAHTGQHIMLLESGRGLAIYAFKHFTLGGALASTAAIAVGCTVRAVRFFPRDSRAREDWWRLMVELYRISKDGVAGRQLNAEKPLAHRGGVC